MLKSNKYRNEKEMEIECNTARIMKEKSEVDRRFSYLSKRFYNQSAYCPRSTLSRVLSLCVDSIKRSLILFFSVTSVMSESRTSRSWWMHDPWYISHVCFLHVKKKARHKAEFYADKSGRFSVSVLRNLALFHCAFMFIYCRHKSIAAGGSVLLRNQSYTDIILCRTVVLLYISLCIYHIISPC